MKTTATVLSTAKVTAGASAGDHALFAGGYAKSNFYSSVEVYNANLIKSTAADLSWDGSSSVNASIKTHALFGNYQCDTMNVYNENLVKSIKIGVSEPRVAPATANIGDYLLLAGGHKGGSPTLNIVDVYTI